MRLEKLLDQYGGMEVVLIFGCIDDIFKKSMQGYVRNMLVGSSVVIISEVLFLEKFY